MTPSDELTTAHRVLDTLTVDGAPSDELTTAHRVLDTLTVDGDLGDSSRPLVERIVLLGGRGQMAATERDRLRALVDHQRATIEEMRGERAQRKELVERLRRRVVRAEADLAGAHVLLDDAGEPDGDDLSLRERVAALIRRAERADVADRSLSGAGIPTSRDDEDLIDAFIEATQDLCGEDLTHEPKIRRGLRTQASTRLADVGYDPADHDGTPANPLASHTLEPDMQIIMNNQPVFLAQSERIHEGEPTGDWLPVLDTTSGSPIVVVARDLREARSVLAGLVSAGRVENPWRAGVMGLVHVTVARSR